jgi:hypothetical protein
MQIETDFIINDQRTVFSVRPVSDHAREWLDEHVDDDALWFGNSLVVEHRFIEALVDGFSNDGLTFEAA